MTMKIRYIYPKLGRIVHMRQFAANNSINIRDLINTYHEEIAKLEKTLSNEKSMPCNTPVERLAMYFEEAAAEMRAFAKNSEYMDMLLVEVNKAIVHAHDELEQIEEQGHAS